MFSQIYVLDGYIIERVLDLEGPKIYVNIFEVVVHRFNIYRALFSYARLFTPEEGNINKLSVEWVKQLTEVANSRPHDFESIVHKWRLLHDQRILRDFINPGHSSDCSVPMVKAYPQLPKLV